VKILINTGLDVNIPDCNGINAVTRAVETNNIMIVESLLKAGAKVPGKDNINGDVVKLAKSVNLEIYKLLINKQT
jgi:ankyrin repeat protein